MTAPATEPTDVTQEQIDAITRLTDEAIEREIRKLEGMVARRQEAIVELQHELCDLEHKHATLVRVRTVHSTMTNEANRLITLLITAAWDLPQLQHLGPLDRLLLLVERAIRHLRRQGIIINP